MITWDKIRTSKMHFICHLVVSVHLVFCYFAVIVTFWLHAKVTML